jgi:kojibiose phosphorylase
MNENWTITQTTYIPDEQGYYETLFALANGYVGIRNTLDFESEQANPGCFFANIYDGALVTRNEIVNAPNWLDFRFNINGTPILLDYAEVLSFKRSLDLKQAIVRTTYRVRDHKGRITKISREEFLCATDHHVAVVRVTINPENYSDTFTLTTTLNYHHGNSMYGGFLKEVRTQHLQNRLSEAGETTYLEVKTIGTKIPIGMASRLVTKETIEERIPYRGKHCVGESIRFFAQKGGTYSFTKFVTFYNGSDEEKNLREACLFKLNEIQRAGIKELYHQHITKWSKRWQKYDVIIEGDERAQEAMRFGIFHLLQTPHPLRNGTNIASRGLTSEYHLGHFFFNTEIYKAPYFMYMDPSFAKSLLQYRYNSLPAARNHARSMGYKGARFSEESDHEGHPAGPTKIRNIFTGVELEEWTGRESHFVGALIAYSIAKYYQITEDHDFILNQGLELLLETARFSASLVKWNNEENRYEIHQVTGPDEYHMHVNNSYFTNYMTKFNLLYALEMVDKFRRRDGAAVNALLKRLDISDHELQLWRNISENLYLPEAREGVFEQFDGYFELEDAWITSYDENNRPVITEEFEDIAKLLLNSNNQIIKQSDVIMLISLFRDRFSYEEKLANMEYYDKRTAHESSLSATHAALVAIDLNQLETAYKYFLICMRFNLDFIPKSDYRNGIHLASYAGGWLVLVEGFCGVKIKGRSLHINPKLPSHWSSVTFNIYWQDQLLRITVKHDLVKIQAVQQGNAEGTIYVGDMAFRFDEVNRSVQAEIRVPVSPSRGHVTSNTKPS